MGADGDNLAALFSSAALVLLGVVLSSVGKLVERVIIARVFSPEAYGEVTLGLAVMTIGSTISMLGLNHGIPRYVSRFEDEADIRGVWALGLGLALGVGTLVALALYLNAQFVTDLVFDGAESLGLLRLFVLAIPVMVGVNVGLSALRGMENTKYKLYTNDIFKPGIRIVLLGALLAGGFGIASAGYAYLLGAVLTFVVTHLFVSRLFDLGGPLRTNGRELLRFSAPLIVTALLSILLTRTDTLMLGYFETSDVVGLYGAAYPLANSMLMVVSSFGYLYLPLTSRLDADGEHEELNAVYRITTKWGYIVTFPAFLAFVLFPDDVLSMFFGGEYAGAGLALAILSLGFFTSAAVGRNRETLSALGHTEQILVADVVAFVGNILLNLVLIPRYGLLGASVASALSYVVRNAVISGVLHWRFGITPVSNRMLRTYVVLPLVWVPTLAALSQWVTLTVVTLPAFLVAVGLATLVVVSVTGCLQPDDMVVVEFVEDAIGREVPLARRYIQSNG